MSIEIISKLQSCAGITVSHSWLEACQNYIRSKNGNPDNEDAILYEILHTDLRQVVTETNTSTSTNQQSSSLSPAMKLLKEAMEKSMTGDLHAQIPSNQSPANSDTNNEDQSTSSSTPFRLMVQVEEILDVSVNAEARYAYGPAHSTSPTPIGQQKHRCLLAEEGLWNWLVRLQLQLYLFLYLYLYLYLRYSFCFRL